MPINQTRLVYVGNALWLAFVYYIVYEVLFLVVPEFIEYWAMGLIAFLIFSALYVNNVGGETKILKFLWITGIDFAISFIFSDFGDFIRFSTGVFFS
jgi:hypothetical protein